MKRCTLILILIALIASLGIGKDKIKENKATVPLYDLGVKSETIVGDVSYTVTDHVEVTITIKDGRPGAEIRFSYEGANILYPITELGPTIDENGKLKYYAILGIHDDTLPVTVKRTYACYGPSYGTKDPVTLTVK
jgi:hypothetical protein